ncbi:MAG: DUF4012 domain-containing protein [Dehalococcoidia bacterium]|nr:DUF4012 domain-containing protein [Dehalococcoidia bacterium]
MPLLLLALALTAALGTLALLHYRGLYSDAEGAKDLLLAAQESLRESRLDATAADLERAEADLTEAEAGFRRTRDSLRSDPLLRLLAWTPWLGEQVDAAEEVLAMGAEASAIGLNGVAVAREYQAVRSEQDSRITEKAMTLLDNVEPHMTAMNAALNSILARRERLDGHPLLPPLRSAVAEVDKRRGELEELVDTYEEAAALFPDFLGFNGPRTYLVLAQNNAELLPTGGLISAYGVVTFNQGRVEEMTFADAIAFGERWQEETGEYVEPPAPLKQYLLKDYSWNLDVANWSPDFPTAARQALFFFEKGGGRPVDGVIGINVSTLQELLSVTGPVTVEEYGVTVNTENALEVTEALTRTPLEPQGDRKAFVAFLAEEMLQRLMRLPSDRWTPLLDALEELRDEKEVLFYSLDPQLQAVAERMGLDGGLRETPGDYLMLVEASVNSTKLNIVIDQEIEVRLALDDLGNAEKEVRVRYRNDLPSWEQGRDPDLVRRLMLDGLYGGYLRLFTAAKSRLVSVEIDGAEAGPSEIGEEQGKGVFGRFFALPSGAAREVAFHWATPAVVDFRGELAEYRLLFQKQPGAAAAPLMVTVSIPPGAELVSLELDGRALEDAGLRVRTDLSRDREIVVKYKPVG